MRRRPEPELFPRHPFVAEGAPLDRRAFLQAGAPAGMLSLAGFLRASAAAEVRGAAAASRIRACIIVFYYGGPSHLDTYDLKPFAPADVRGEFQPISTSVPGLHVCEHLPHMARQMHRVCQIRTMSHGNRLHDSASTEALTGRQSPQGDREEFAAIEQFYPCYGAALSHLSRGGAADPVVRHAALPFVFHNVVDVPCQAGGFLGRAFAPLQIDVDAATRTYHAGAIALPAELAGARLQQRRSLLTSLEPARHDATARAEWQLYYDKAFGLLGSEELRVALDISRETDAARARYGFGAAPLKTGEGGGGGNGAELGTAREMRGQNLLLARRLVEAGIPFVNVYDFRQQGQNWDAHFSVFNQHKTHLLPLADQSLAALLDDLDERGLLDSTLVVAMGEFGRTPRINANAGRDHWPDCYTILLAGGGIRGGTVHGASDKLAAYPSHDPVTPADLAATIYWRFGFDPATEIHDTTGRPHRLADGQPLTHLFA